MSTVSAKDVKDLNARIEKIHTEQTKVETQKSLLQKQLQAELAEYKKQFGVDLTGKTFKEIQKKVLSEEKKVSEEVQKEYELKEKVVAAIEAKDYDLAYSLLGIKLEAEEEEPEQEENFDISQNTVVEDNIEEDDFSLEDSEEGINVPEIEDTDFEEEEDLDFGLDDFSLEEEMGEEAEQESEDEEKPKKSTPKMESAKDIFASMGDMVIEGDDTGDLEDGDDFGFGDMLKDSKFEIE